MKQHVTLPQPHPWTPLVPGKSACGTCGYSRFNPIHRPNPRRRYTPGPWFNMPRFPPLKAVGLPDDKGYRRSIYRDNGGSHTLVAEVYTHEDALAIQQTPRMIQALEATLDWFTGGGTPPSSPEEAELVEELRAILADARNDKRIVGYLFNNTHFCRLHREYPDHDTAITSEAVSSQPEMCFVCGTLVVPAFREVG